MANEAPSATQRTEKLGGSETRKKSKRQFFGKLLARDAGASPLQLSRTRKANGADRGLASGAASVRSVVRDGRDEQRIDALEGAAEDDGAKDNTSEESTDPDEGEDMWAEAETKLREDAAKRAVLDQYDRILVERFGEPLQPIGTRARHEQFQRFFELELAAKEKADAEDGKADRYRHQAGRIVKAVAKAVVATNDVIQPATSSFLPAGVACTGVVVVVSFCLKAVDQRDRLFDSLDSIAHSVCRIAEYEKLCRGRISEKSIETSAAFIKACSNILEFQARVVCFLQKNATKQFVRNMFECDGWNDLLKGIREAEDRVFRCAQSHQMKNTQLIFRQVHTLTTELQRRDRESDAQRLNERANRFLKLLYKNTCRYLETKKRNAKHVPGTCEWFTNHTLFNGWRAGAGPSNILYVTADPGCGKSVLSTYLIDEVLTGRDEDVCYFFFKDDFEDQKTATSALCAILHQLFDKNRHLLTPSVLDTYEARGDKIVSSFTDLWPILDTAASTQNIVCVLDALDECYEADMMQLIKAITNTTTLGVKFLLTSRPYAYIRRTITQALPYHVTKDDVSRIHLQGDSEESAGQIAQEITLVVGARVNSIADTLGLDTDERQLVLDRLLSFKDRTYLWVTLIFDGLVTGKAGITKKGILAITKQLPQGIYAAYERILRRSQDQKRTRRLLSLVLGAQRPLTLAEVSVALELSGPMQSWEEVQDLVIPESRTREAIRDLCGLFVTVVDNRVYLLHQTAREFLLRNGAEPAKEEAQSALVPGHTGKNAAIAWAAHAWALCLALLLHVLHQLWLFLTKSWQHSMDLTASNELLAAACMACLQPGFPRDWNPSLFTYAAEYWPAHYRQSSSSFRAKRGKTAHNLCVDSPSNREWTERGLRDRSMGADGLRLACYLGLDGAVEEFLAEICSSTQTSSEDEINKKGDSGGRTALMLAVREGHVAVVRLLLQTGKANVNSGDDLGLRISGFPGLIRHKVIRVTALRESRPVDVGLKDSLGWTPPPHAVTVPWRVMKRRLRLWDSTGQTPLSYAAEQGRDDVMQLLLAKNAEVDAKDSSGRTPLSFAAGSGQQLATQLLLANNAEVNVPDSSGRTPLSYAAESGRELTTQLLLANNAEVDATDSSGRTPLSYAAENMYNNEKVVQLLLANHAEADAKDSSGRTPLSYAAENESGNEKVVRLLLAKHVEVDSKDEKGLTPLYYAADNQNTTVAKMLLDTGKVNTTDEPYIKMMEQAWKYQELDVYSLLLAYQADGGARDCKDEQGQQRLSVDLSTTT